MESRQIRVRFAPSPTGYLHVGGARTALFNWLFARNKGGLFVLRIEDTDLERSSGEMTRVILDSLQWLGIDWDEGPYYQAQRSRLHAENAQRLLEQGKAYRCFCSPEELERKRQTAAEKKQAWIYDRACLQLDQKQADARAREGIASVIRFRVPDSGETAFEDIIQGPIRFENRLIEDFVLTRSDGMPTYHLSVVSDDIEMQITHIIRGADHISNTPKQVLLYQALGHPVPRLGHLPLILGSDKKRLSKRHGATSVEIYREQGILPEAMANYLALLGWSPGSGQEVFSIEEMVERFDLSRINKANAVFDPAKLEWINAQHIQRMELGVMAARVRSWLAKEGMLADSFAVDEKTMQSAVNLLRSRCKTLKDFTTWGRAFFVEQFEIDPAGREKYLSNPAAAAALADLASQYQSLEEFSLESTERVLRGIAAERGLKAGDLIGAARVAVTGNPVAPGLFEVLLYLGRERTVMRLKKAAGKA
ncbi:MAG TPA: glutamate--tRNA ligase [Acidobacteriota bacterium]|jgi:glutamyl-tRNA synthetase